MGMDVYGKNPTNEAGKYFRNNVWWWRPLATYILETAPQSITSQCEHWGTNDGDGLDAERSSKLADFLRSQIAFGQTKAYGEIRVAELAAMPDEPCDLCHATGTRSDGVGVSGGMTTKVIEKEGHPRKGETGWCNKCDGVGHVRPYETHYPFSVENVAAFCTFLEACGGFEIN
jgi:hypothetical protein